MPYPMQNPYQSYFQQFPQYQAQSYQMPQSTPQQNGGITWVNSLTEAQQYIMPPNSAVTLWDSNSPTVYVKQTDASGRPTLKVYDLVERSQMPSTASQNQTPEYVTRSDFDALAAKVEAITGKKVKIKQEADE